MTYEQFCTLVEAGENPYLMAFNDPDLEPLMERWMDDHRAPCDDAEFGMSP